MITSRIVYIPHTGRKNTVAIIADATHQLLLRAKRKFPGHDFDVAWASCRCDPGIWLLSLETRMPTISAVKENVKVVDGVEIEWVK